MSTFRITTNGMFRNYRSNLNKNNKRLNDTMTDVQTQRKFNTYAEDPAQASKAWRLRRSFWNTGNQIDNNTYVISKYESAYSAMAAIVDGDTEHPGLDGLLATIEGVSDSSGAARVALGRDLLSTAESIVSMMNTKYGDDFVFAGADGANIPFAWNDDGTKLLYRGVDVSIGEPQPVSNFFTSDDLKPYGLTSAALDDYDETKTDIEDVKLPEPLTSSQYKAANPDATDADYAAYKADYTDKYLPLKGVSNVNDFEQARQFYDKFGSFMKYAAEYSNKNGGTTYSEGVKNYEKLEKMAGESTYLDIGLGLKEDDKGNFVTGSAFNSAVSGLTFLGYGEDKNLAVLVKELGSIFYRADPESGDYASDEDRERASVLLDKIHDGIRSAQGQHVQLSADAKYLKTNLKQLETVKSELNEQIMDTESMDPAEAITEMTWAQYCYNAALRIGTNILSQSLIDYLQ
jgi:flagellin-like hook-associated protein FlgL